MCKNRMSAFEMLCRSMQPVAASTMIVDSSCNDCSSAIEYKLIDSNNAYFFHLVSLVKEH